MSRLIDADALKRRAQRVATESWKMGLTARIETTLNQFIDWIDNAPTVQPEDCALNEFGDCSYSETGCSDCKIKNKIRTALNVAQPEIVRCKDCKWYELPSHKITENCVRWMKRNSILLPIKPDDYCSYAERRTDG